MGDNKYLRAEKYLYEITGNHNTTYSDSEINYFISRVKDKFFKNDPNWDLFKSSVVSEWKSKLKVKHDKRTKD